MIHKYGIENFKSFSRKQNFDLAPITIIFGPNSSGKSSIIQSILMMKSTILGRNSHAGIETSNSNSTLGTYNTIVNQHDTKKDISIDIEFNSILDLSDYQPLVAERPIFGIDDRKILNFTYSAHKTNKKQNNHLKEMKFEAISTRSGQSILNFSIKNFPIHEKDEQQSVFNFTEKSITELYKYFKKREKFSRVYKKFGDTIINELASPLKIHDNYNIPISHSEPEVSVFLESIFNEFRQEVLSVKHLGPLRSAPKRFYAEFNNHGEDSPEIISLANSIEHDSEKIKHVNYWFDKFDIPYTLEIFDIGNEITGRVISLLLTDKRTSTVVTPVDVGYGIGQVLPIIAEAVSSKNSIICVEQPEIHLHPRLQAHVADLIIDSMKGNNQWIIETHSEALMLRIQKRIRKKELSNTHVKVIYVQADSDGSSIIDIPLDEEGDFMVEWPDGFFEERLNEQFG